MSKAGTQISNLSGDAAYKSFRPAPLPPQLDTDHEMLALLAEASKALAALDTLATHIPNMNLFISMYVRKEALLSSQIEGTQATLEDVLDPLIEKNANQNVTDVINYVKATEFALTRMKELPLCNRLLRETHAVLMQGVRGQEKHPGEFRTSQNWIGAQGCSIKNARYVPPNPHDMIEAISDLEKYMNEDDSLDVLIKAALIHYQFETIHPFLDGNGRIGRLLITLFLLDKQALHSPALYVSYFLKLNRIEYYDRMSEVRQKDNYEQWIKFFLLAVKASADDAVETILKLNALHNKNVALLEKTSRNKTALALFSYIEQNPIIDIGKTAHDLGISFNTASSHIHRLADCRILTQTDNAARKRVYAYEDYLSILRKDT